MEVPTRPTIETFQGELEVTGLSESTGPKSPYEVITGRGDSRRSWQVDEATFNEYREKLRTYRGKVHAANDRNIC